MSFFDRAALFENKFQLEAEGLTTSSQVFADVSLQNVGGSAEVSVMSGVPEEVKQQMAEEIKEKEEALNAGVQIYS